MDRGGYPLKVEFSLGEELVSRVVIKLEQVSQPDGTKIWFPMEAEAKSFLLSDGSCSAEPQTRETYSVVNGSFVLNAWLSDNRFSVDWKGDAYGRADLSQPLPQPINQPVPPPRTDPEGVRKNLEEKRIEADCQARQLDAAAPARNFWGRCRRANSSLELLESSLSEARGDGVGGDDEHRSHWVACS
jgi:hypothetical protein